MRVIANRTLARAVERRDAFFPQAEATDDIAGTLARPDIAVVDLTPHPAERAPMIEAALRAGKHVLSQKPFVLDLDTGERLADLAATQGRMLAVNQNGRWAPHLSWMREAVRAGLVGEVQSVHLSVHWDHSWIAGTAFERIDDLILYDFAIHWFDFLASLIGASATRVMGTRNRAAGQTVAPPFLSQTLVEFPGGQAAVLFDAATRHGPLDRSVITGSLGTLASHGPDLGQQQVTLTTAAGVAHPFCRAHGSTTASRARWARFSEPSKPALRPSTTPAATSTASPSPSPPSPPRGGARPLFRGRCARCAKRVRLALGRSARLAASLFARRAHARPVSSVFVHGIEELVSQNRIVPRNQAGTRCRTRETSCFNSARCSAPRTARRWR